MTAGLPAGERPGVVDGPRGGHHRGDRRILLAAGVPAALVLLVALVGPLVAGSPTAVVGGQLVPPGPGVPLGTDVLGRDTLSRVLHGGWPVVAVTAAATVLAAMTGTVVGVAGAMAPRRVGEMITRIVDLLLIVPPLILLLVFAAGFPGSDLALAVAVAAISAPLTARVVRAASLRVVRQGYVEVARARGDRGVEVLVRDVLPNVLGVVLADAGVRFVTSLYLTSTVGFLGLGAPPPASNWGRMVDENLEGATLNPLPIVVPVLLLVLLAVTTNLVADVLARRAGDHS